MDDFKTAWERYYPGYYPIGYIMRHAGAKHWLRFHSLPESKQYADTDNERQLLLGRQNELASKILGDEAACWLVQACWETPEGSIDVADRHDPFWACREFDLSFSFSFIQDGDESGWNVYARLLRWQKHGFDKLLLAIADERAAPTLWVSAFTGRYLHLTMAEWIFSCQHFSAAEKLANTHPNWLPSNVQGL